MSVGLGHSYVEDFFISSVCVKPMQKIESKGKENKGLEKESRLENLPRVVVISSEIQWWILP